MDRVDKIIAMISDVVVNTYSCGEPLFTNQTTSLSVEKDDVLKKVEQNTSNPMSFRGFVKRMQTYNIVCWYVHRRLALQLARRGWENVKDYVVKCCFCTAEVDLRNHISSQEEELLQLLYKRHASFCRWLTITSPEFFACVPHVQSSQGLKNTVATTATQLLELGQELPKIPEVVLHKMKLEHETLELLISGLLKDVSVSEISISAVALTLCGWSPASTKGILCCCYCDRRLALRHWMSIQEFDEQRRLVLSDSNMKICSASYMQSSYADGAEEEDDDSQSPLSDQSIITDCSDEEEEVDEEEEENEEEFEEENEEGNEEMEVEEYELYEKHAEQDNECGNNEISDDGEEQSSQTRNCQNEDNIENKYEDFQCRDEEMDENYDEINARALEENNFDDDDDEETEDEMPPNENGPSDEEVEEAEVSDESIMSDNEFKNENPKIFRGPNKHTRYQSYVKRNKDSSNDLQAQYDSCGNEEDVESSEDDLLVENEVEDGDEEEEENEQNEGEEIGEEEDDEDDDDDDEEEEEDDEEEDDDDKDDEDDEELPDDSKYHENNSDKVIELLSDSDEEIEQQPIEKIQSDSDEEIESQPVEQVQSVSSPTSAVVLETQTVVKENNVSNENKQSHCEKLCVEPKTETENNDVDVREIIEKEIECDSDIALRSECENQEVKSLSLAEAIIMDDSKVRESQYDGNNSTQQEKVTLKRKRDCDEVETEQSLSIKRQQISLHESDKPLRVNENDMVITGGNPDCDKNNIEVEENTCSEGNDKNAEMVNSKALNENDCKTSAACERSVVVELVEHSKSQKECKLNGTLSLSKEKCELSVNSCEDSASAAVEGTNNLEQTCIENIEESVSSTAEMQTGVSETPAHSQNVVQKPLPKSEINSEVTVLKIETVCSIDTTQVIQKQKSRGKFVENNCTNVPLLLPEMPSENGLVIVQEEVCNVENTSSNIPLLLLENRSSDDDAGQEKGVICDKGGEPEVLATVQAVQDNSGEVEQAQILGEKAENKDAQLEVPPLPGVQNGGGEVVENNSARGEETTKEDSVLSEVSCSLKGTSLPTEKGSENELSLQAGEDVKDTTVTNEAEDRTVGETTSLNNGNTSEEVVQEYKSSEGNECSEELNPEECVHNNEESSTCDKSEADKKGEEGVTEMCESEALSVCAEKDGVMLEAMEVCEAGEQSSSRGVKRNRESDLEHSSPEAKRPHQSTEVRRQPSLLDPLAEHRFWCLWAPSRGSASFGQSGFEIVFKEILDKILLQRREQDEMDIIGKLRSTQEQIMPL